MGPSLLRRVVAVVATAVALVAGLSGCGQDEFEDRTAVVTVGGASQSYDVQSCGLDEQTVFLVALASDGSVVQAVMGLEDDDTTGIPDSTGATIDLDPNASGLRLAAFGPESWERRGESGQAPGSIASAQLNGSRIQFSGDAVEVGADDIAVTGSAPRSFSVDARCDLQED